METRRIRARDGVALSYRVAGEGSPVMLLHGFANWSEMWLANGVASRLAETRAVLLPDRRGHGHSGRPTGPRHYGRRMVEDVFDILDAESIGSAHLAGFSQGAEIALAAAALRPGRVRSVYLVASGWPGPELPEALAIYRDVLDGIETAILAGKPWLTPVPDMEIFRAICASIEDVIDIPRHDIAVLDLPAAGLAGGLDPERPTLERLVGVLRGFSLDVLRGVGHGDLWRHPSLPGRIVEFLDRAETG